MENMRWLPRWSAWLRPDLFGGKAVKGYMDKKASVAATETLRGRGKRALKPGRWMKARWPLRRPPARPGMRSGFANAQAVVDSYANIGVVQVSGYLNMRKKPESGSQVVESSWTAAACEDPGDPGRLVSRQFRRDRRLCEL